MLYYILTQINIFWYTSYFVKSLNKFSNNILRELANNFHPIIKFRISLPQTKILVSFDVMFTLSVNFTRIRILCSRFPTASFNSWITFLYFVVSVLTNLTYNWMLNSMSYHFIDGITSIDVASFYLQFYIEPAKKLI